VSTGFHGNHLIIHYLEVELNQILFFREQIWEDAVISLSD